MTVTYNHDRSRDARHKRYNELAAKQCDLPMRPDLLILMLPFPPFGYTMDSRETTPPKRHKQMTEFHVRLTSTTDCLESTILYRFSGSTAEQDAHKAAVEFCGHYYNGVRASAIYLRTAKPFENAKIEITCAQTF